MNKIGGIVAVVVGVSTMLGTAFTIDSRYAKVDEVDEMMVYVTQVDKRLEIKILKDRADALQGRMWKLEDRYGMVVTDMPEEVREQYRELKKEYDEIIEKIKGDDKPKKDKT